MTEDEDKDISAELSTRVADLAKQDAGYVILTLAITEQLLETVLLAHLPKLEDQKADLLFRYGGAAGTFSAKLKLAYALGLIDAETYKDLLGIRYVRNAFAHPRGFLHFGDPEMAKVFKRIKHWPEQPDLKALYDQRLWRATKAIKAKYDSLLYAYAAKDA